MSATDAKIDTASEVAASEEPKVVEATKPESTEETKEETSSVAPSVCISPQTVAMLKLGG